MRDTTMKRSAKEQVLTGLRVGFGCVAGICLGMLLVYGVLRLRFPETDNSVFYFLRGYPSQIVGGTCVAVAVAILWLTVDRWAKILSGFFGYAVFGGLLAVAAGGFHSHIASLQLTRLDAAIMSALYLVCCLLTIRLNDGRLNWVDRIAAMLAPLLLTFAGTSTHAGTGFKMLLSMVVIFAAAAAYHYVWCRRSRTRGLVNRHQRK
jgi:hypothetical protein